MDLFGNETLIQPKRKKRELFSDYDGFVEKFKNKKTTNDCYTPPHVYETILNYVQEKCDIKGLEVVRPFYPGGDYENYDYPENCVVIDNPPFSILAKIARFYIQRNIKFFIFAPHLTLFSSNVDCTRIVCNACIIYENGAKINTSFLSNMFGDIVVFGDHQLYEKLEKANSTIKKSIKRPKYVYPERLITVSSISKIVNSGVSIKFHKKELIKIEKLDCQKIYKKSIFGDGFIISGKALERIKKAEAESEKKAEAIVWEFSEAEKIAIKKLDKSSRKDKKNTFYPCLNKKSITLLLALSITLLSNSI